MNLVSPVPSVGSPSLRLSAPIKSCQMGATVEASSAAFATCYKLKHQQTYIFQQLYLGEADAISYSSVDGLQRVLQMEFILELPIGESKYSASFFCSQSIIFGTSTADTFMSIPP